MLESRTDYYILLSEAFGPSVPGTREERKKIYDGVRKALKEQSKLAPHRFDLGSEQRALEKAILDVEISAKLGQAIPRRKPGTEPPPQAKPSPPRMAAATQPPSTPAQYVSASPATEPPPAYNVPPQPAGPRIEWTDHATGIPMQEQEAYFSPPPPLAPLPSTSPVRRPQTQTYQPAFLNRPDRVSYARRADPPPPAPSPPPPPPAPKAEAPLPPGEPEVRPQPAAQPQPRASQPAAVAEAEGVHRLDGAPGKKPAPKKSFRPAGVPEEKPRSSGMRIALIVLLAACAGGAIAYFVKPDQFIRQMIAEFRSKGTSKTSAPAPSPTGASVSVGESPKPGPQDYVQLAISQTAKRDYSGALATLEQAEKMGASGGEFHQARAYAFWGSGNPERAIAEYGEAIRLDPGNATNFANRAVAYNARNEYALAIRDLERAIAIDPSNPDHWNSRCWARALAGQLQEAIVDCNESLRLRPNDPNTLDSRGFAHLKAGQNTRAIADFTAVLAGAPQTASSLYGRGLARTRTGDRANGSKDIAEAKALSPNIDSLFAQYGVR